MQPLFSIVIPTYNGEKTIKTLLKSIVSCNLPFLIEIIIIDSTSSDKTISAIKSQNDKRIRLYKIDKSTFNHGLTRNFGVQNSRGKYIFFFSQDAKIISKNIFTRTLRNFNKNPDCAISFVRQIPYESTPFIQQLEATVYFDDLNAFVNANGQVRQTFKKPFTPFEGTNKMLWYFNSDVAACYRKDYLVQYPFPKTEHGGEDVFAAKQALELGFSKIYDSKLVVQHSHSYSFWEYIKREKVEVGLVTQHLRVPKKTRFVCKLKRIIHSKNQCVLMKVALCIELIVLYFAKLVIFLTKKMNGRGLYISMITAQIGLIILLSAYIWTKRSANVNVAPLDKNNYIKTAGELKYFYEPANVPFDEPLPWNPDIKVKYTMNKDTIRANKEYAIPKPPDTLRIVAIGDSFTFGQFVKDDETYPAQLEVLLKEKLKGKYKDVEVINLGVPGYDIEYSIARYEKRGRKYNPDYVLWFLTTDDYIQNNEFELQLIKKIEDNLSEDSIEKYKNMGIYYPAHHIARERLRNNINKNQNVTRNIEGISSFNSRYQEKKAYISIESTDKDFLSYLKAVTIKFGIPFIITSNIYSDKSFFLPDSHFNGKGYGLLSEEIASFLSDKIFR